MSPTSIHKASHEFPRTSSGPLLAQAASFPHLVEPCDQAQTAFNMLLAHVPTQAKIWGVSVAACAVIVGVLCRRRKLPPMSPAGLLEVVQQMGSRGTPPKFLLRMRKAAGSTIFRINLPLWNHFCVVADPDVAKAILTHPRTEKTPLYKSMTPIFEGTESMFTKYTFNDGWDWSRKGCARAFLGFNVSTASNAAGPHLTVLDEVLHEHIASSKPFDAAEIMVQLTLDMLAASGFGNFPMNAMRGGKSSEGYSIAWTLYELLGRLLHRLDPLRALDPP
eukprot:3672119-Rhodomonas_salina.2